MPRSCSLCAHPQQLEIETLRKGGATLSALVAAFGIKQSALHRHLTGQCRSRLEAILEPGKGRQPPAGRVGVRKPPVAALAPPTRTRAIGGAFRAAQSIAPNPGPAETSNVLTFREPTKVDPRVPAEMSLADLARTVSSGYSDAEIASQLGWPEDKVRTTVEKVQEARRAMLETSREDLAAYFYWSKLEQIGRLRRKLNEADAGLRHREADRYAAQLATAERELFTMLERLGMLGQLDQVQFSKGGRDANEMFAMVMNGARGVFEPPPSPESRPKPLLRA